MTTATAQHPGPLSLADWIEERRANCVRLARRANKTGRDGWLEDARYFRTIAATLAEIERAQANESALMALLDKRAADLAEKDEQIRKLLDAHYVPKP